MAPGTLSPQLPSAPYGLATGSASSKTSRNASAVYGQHHDEEYSSETVESRQRAMSQRLFSRKSSMLNVSNISNVVYSIKRRSSGELGSNISARLFSATHESLLEWISAQRMSDLPPEGSSYDKVLAWAQLFANRLHSFEYAIQEFAGDSYLAAQLAYGYCSLLLELGKENARALMISFGFFYSTSVPLLNLLERIELFSVSQEIREQLVLALSDLVSLVASVATYFHKAIGETTTSVSVNIYSTFPTQIRTFLERCDKTAELMWQHRLLKEGVTESRVSQIRAIKAWIAPEDQVLSRVVNSTSQSAHDREELTCLYIGAYLTRFLKGSQKTMALSGPPGSGKTVLASVIFDYLQHPIAGVNYSALFVPINGHVPGETTPRAVAKSLLYQLFQKRTGNVQLLNILTEAFERTVRMTTEDEYDNILWQTVERAVTANLPGAKDLVFVLDGLDECSAGEEALFKRLQSVANTKGASTLKLITLGTKPQQGVQNLQINEDLIFDDIMAVVRNYFEASKLYISMSEMEREALVAGIATASKGSFVWAKQACKQLRRVTTVKELFSSLEKIGNCSIAEFVHRTLTAPEVTYQTRLLLTWLVTAERPLSTNELATLASINVDKQTIDHDHKIDVMSTLRPVNSLVFMQDGLTYLRHDVVRKAATQCLNETKGSIKDRHGDLATRLLIYINSTVIDPREPTLTVLDSYSVQQLTSRHTLLEFAISYWPLHLRKSFAFLKPDTSKSEAAKLVPKVVPKNLTVYLLQAALWQHQPLPNQLKYHTMMTNITRQLLTTKSTITLQSIIFLAQIYRRIEFTPDATTLFYEATTVSNSLLTSKSPITMELAKIFTELTSTRVTTSKTDVIMTHREQVLLILTECYKIQYGQKSEYVLTTLTLLVEHYRTVKDETKTQQMITKIRGDKNDTLDEDLHVHLHGRKDTQGGHAGSGVVLTLDTEEQDEVIEGRGAGAAYDFEFFLVKAERYLAEGRTELAEKTYIEIWERVTREYRATHSALWEERKMKSVVCYSRFLMQHKRTEHARSILCTAWEEYRYSSSQSVMTESTSAM
ncbi:uncharacterized protein B0I36DRAFT_368709 [Microdochium trichocladiopsis]|uniref:Nephrocystin 3-like N-terminal domain-containing protein n=1 Tax=Microdochium trichocladiopsis TaxID=1682393 RepID=A0A9P8XUD8_9PEZI|nr:uncharacterized protein B0I36DRAFT_368709 [Microdochium trichocladiopsis]KAH7016094.1 hypothetical protein B0I36DRAFT_368709 [Microdochium trichocladiopsis]